MSLKKNYIIMEKTGSGAMATVSKAVQKSLDRFVAVKQIHPHLSQDTHYVSRLEREAKAAASLEHVNVIDIIDFGQEEEQYYIVAEFIDGPTLAQVMKSANNLPLPVALSIIIQILQGLEHAHNKGIVHRDIKPDNIMFTSSGVAKITDFGVAKAGDLPSLTQSGKKVIGTPTHMSPEQAEGKKADHRSDLFAVGILLYEMLTNELPFTGGSVVLTLKKLIEEPHAPIKSINPAIPDELCRIVDRALEKDVSRRFFDATEFVYALEVFSFEAGIRFDVRDVKQYFESCGPLLDEIIKEEGMSSSQIRREFATTGIGRKRPTAAILPLTGCFGCQVNLLDLHERFQRIYEMVDIKFSYFMDIKEIPEVDIGIVEGSVSNNENERLLKELRSKCKTLVALGTCASFGGIPGLRNLHPVHEVVNRSYFGSESTKKLGIVPDSPAIPAICEHVRTVADVVETDYIVPGCPSPRRLIMDLFESLTTGVPMTLPTPTLCFECPRTRKEMMNPKREFIAEKINPIMELETIDPDTCFLEQGVLCMGMTTQSGCGARCVGQNIPCQGCMGPAPQVRETGAKWINALGSLLPGGSMRFRHDLVGIGYCYTLPISMMPFKRD